MSSQEFSEWQAFARLEPFGEERADLRSAIVAAVIANTQRNPKKRAKPFEVQDFMPRFEADGAGKEPMSTEAMLNVVQELNAAFGGKDERKR